MMKKSETEAGSTRRASVKTLRHVVCAAVVVLMICLVLAAPAAADTELPAKNSLVLNVPPGMSLDTDFVQVSATYYDAEGKPRITYVSWKIDDKSVIGLSNMRQSSVHLCPRGLGTATLYAELSDNPLINASVEIPVVKTEIVRIVGGYSSNTISHGTTATAWAEAVDQFGKEFSYNEVEWSVKNGNVSLTFPEKEKNHKVIITPVSTGTDTVTATSISNPELSWSFDVEVVPGQTIPEAGDPHLVGFSDYNSYLTVDAVPGYARAYVYDEYGNTLYEDDIVWEIDNESVAVFSVDTDINDETHKVTLTPKNKGTAVLTAYAKNNKLLNDSIVVHVEDTVVTTVHGPWIPSRLTVTDSSSYGGIVYVYDQFGNEIPDASVTITVSDSSVMTLSTRGQSGNSVTVENGDAVTVHVISPGTVTVTTVSTTDASVKEVRTVTAENPKKISLISLQGYADRIFTTEAYAGISAAVHDLYGDLIDNAELVWTIGNLSVLEISRSGGDKIWADLQPIAPGTTTIRAALKSDRTVYDEITVTVEESVISSVRMGGQFEMSTISEGWAYAYVLNQVGGELYDEEISWKIDNPAIVELDEDISSYVTIIPKAVGSTKIHATSVSDPSVTWSMTVTVEKPSITKLYPLYSSRVIPMNSLDSISAKMQDQFGSVSSSAELYWAVDNASVLELSSAYSKQGKESII